MKDDILILGGGLAGLSLAYFLDKASTILETQDSVGGLARSHQTHGVTYDNGPHIIFSKNKRILAMMNEMSDNITLKRSNQIYHNGHFIQYPFENYLAQLGNQKEIDYCLNTFLNNPRRDMQPTNLLDFFLKTFGEGITRIYLKPYNEKIWKYDLEKMSTQMVGRIPRPPDSHIISSCKGEFHEGYLHQLNFRYPKKGGIQSLCEGFKKKLAGKSEIKLNRRVVKITREGGTWLAESSNGDSFHGNTIINCMPVHELLKCLEDIPSRVKKAAADLKYNSIYIVVINVKRESVGNHLAVLFPQKDTLFHRLSRINYLGKNYALPDGSTTLLLEVTFRPGDAYDGMGCEEVILRCISDLDGLGLISKDDVNFTDIRKEEYAYVVYDLKHKDNQSTVLSYLRSTGIECNGRFAEFEYLNMDNVIEHSMNLAGTINKEAKRG